MDGYHHANHHVSTGTSQILVVWGQDSLKCHGAICVSRSHTVKLLQENIAGFPSRKNAHQECELQLSWWYLHQDTTQNKCSNARQEHLRKIKSNKVSEAISLEDHGGVGFITRPYRANISMFITGTCSQRRSKITIT